ncbi:MAG: glycosyltransferase family 2 protein [Methylohalobius sp. ZOD2]
MTAYSKIFIVVLNWNGRDDTLACLDSVFKIDYPNFDVVVVDNGSTDDSVPAIRKAFPQSYLIETKKNLGYAEGNNVGMRYALEQETDFIFILNNDTKVAPDILNHLLEAFDDHPKAAALGPVVYEMNRPEIIWTAGEFFDKDGYPYSAKQGDTQIPTNSNKVLETEWINGAAFFSRFDILKNIGLFDSRFFLTYEDSDWCFRARKMGYSCLMVPNARIWHKVASSFDSESSPLRAYYSTRNKLLFAEKNLPKLEWLRRLLCHLSFLIPKMNFTLPFHSNPSLYLKWLFWKIREAYHLWNNPRQKAIRFGIRDYFLRRFGECPRNIWELQSQWKQLKQK